MGRDRRNEARIEHFAKLPRTLMETPAWRALGPVAQALYPWLKLEWHGPKANNNGKIQFSNRQAGACMGCNEKTAGKAFHQLQAKGFIVQKVGAVLGTAGSGEAPHYELTEIEMPGATTKGGRRLYQQWSEGNDCPVIKAQTNNPNGLNGKIKLPAQ